jgi:hypothetical protein
MQYLIAIALLFLIGYFTIVYIGNKQYAAKGYVKAGEGKIESEIILKYSNNIPLLAMALCYLAKIKWLLLSEPAGTEKTFTTVFNNTLNSWPDIPYVEMLASIRKNISTYQVTVYYSRRKGWYVINKIPFKGYYSGDLVTSYFILLKTILTKLNANEKSQLGDMLNKLKKELLEISGKDRSHDGLSKILTKANNILSQENIEKTV